jgi:hypothetical protein
MASRAYLTTGAGTYHSICRHMYHIQLSHTQQLRLAFVAESEMAQRLDGLTQVRIGVSRKAPRRLQKCIQYR